MWRCVWWRCKARGGRWRCEVEVWRCGGVRWCGGSPARRRAACRAGMTWRLTSDEPRRFATRDSPYRAAPRCVARELGPRNSEPGTSHFALRIWHLAGRGARPSRGRGRGRCRCRRRPCQLGGLGPRFDGDRTPRRRQSTARRTPIKKKGNCAIKTRPRRAFGKRPP